MYFLAKKGQKNFQKFCNFIGERGYLKPPTSFTLKLMYGWNQIQTKRTMRKHSWQYLCKSLPALLINLACEKKYWTVVVKMLSTKLLLLYLATCSILQSAVCIFEDQTDLSFKINAVYKGKNVRTITTSHMYIHAQIVSFTDIS